MIHDYIGVLHWSQAYWTFTDSLLAKKLKIYLWQICQIWFKYHLKYFGVSKYQAPSDGVSGAILLRIVKFIWAKSWWTSGFDGVKWVNQHQMRCKTFFAMTTTIFYEIPCSLVWIAFHIFIERCITIEVRILSILSGNRICPHQSQKITHKAVNLHFLLLLLQWWHVKAKALMFRTNFNL